MFPRGRKILLGISASIAAYKSADLIRRLQEEGYSITVVPTKNSLNFVGVATWEALSRNKVHTDLWADVAAAAHTDLARSAELIVIAPTTADLLAKLANGICDDLLTNIVLASQASKVLVPSMHPQMWQNPATVANVKTLRERGFIVIEPEFGKMTGDDVGIGRYPQTATIINQINSTLNHKADLKGKKILISAGGTIEAIDPVRFIGNRSSGKQGFALANAALRRGADVHLVVAGNLLNEQIESQEDFEGLTVTSVQTAAELAAVLKTEAPFSDAIIMSAAVADAKPASESKNKIKKNDYQAIELVKNEDILQSLSNLRKEKALYSQVIVGFAAETFATEDDNQSKKIENDKSWKTELINSGRRKLNQKNVDFVYVNDVSGGKVFGSDETAGVLLSENGEIFEVNTTSKFDLANQILDKVSTRFRTTSEVINER